jgi:hypothetical protein
MVSYQLEGSLRRTRVFDLLPCLQSLLSEGSICCPGSAQSYIFDYFIAGESVDALAGLLFFIFLVFLLLGSWEEMES